MATDEREGAGRVRRERDLLGERDVPASALHGIHTVRALENFPLARRPVHRALARAYGSVKLACLLAARECGAWDEDAEGAAALERACRELADGLLDQHVVVDALQGGAGTSTNENVNEVLANRALQLLGRAPGDYARLSPHDHVNRFQSTNDTYPTALRVAAIRGLRALEGELVALQDALQVKERAFADVVKVGRTELQDAVLLTLGREVSAWAEAVGRDRWRVSKCEERLRVVNLGGTAVGTAQGAPRRYVFRATDRLRELTGLGLARAENLVDATQNADPFVEVSGILTACATNLYKISNDLRLLSSGPEAGLGELRLPPRQAGSSLMPGKVNPVIPEAVAQAALLAMGQGTVVTAAVAASNLELPQFLPLVAHCLLETLDLLAGGARILCQHCVRGLEADRPRCAAHVSSSTAALTALVPVLGYEGAQDLALEAARTGRPLRALAAERCGLDGERFDALTAPEAVDRLGEP